MGALAVIDRPSAGEGDVVRGTYLGAFAAGDAPVRDGEGFVPDDEFVKHAVDYAALQAVEGAGGALGEGLAAADELRSALEHRAGAADYALRLLGARRAEERDVVFRHDDLEHAAVIEPPFRAEGAQALSGVADFAAAGHDEIRLAAAVQPRRAYEPGKNPRQLPAVGG